MVSTAPTYQVSNRLSVSTARPVRSLFTSVYDRCDVDTTTIAERGRYFGLTLVAVYVAVTLGPIFSLFLSISAVRVIAGIAGVLNVLYICLLYTSPSPRD